MLQYLVLERTDSSSLWPVPTTVTVIAKITNTTNKHLWPTLKRIGSPGLLPSSPARSCCCFRARFCIIFSKRRLLGFGLGWFSFICLHVRNGAPKQFFGLIHKNSLHPNNMFNRQLIIFWKHIVWKLQGTALDNLQNTKYGGQTKTRW